METLLRQLHADNILTIDFEKLNAKIKETRTDIVTARSTSNRAALGTLRPQLNFLNDLKETCYKHKVNEINISTLLPVTEIDTTTINNDGE